MSALPTELREVRCANNEADWVPLSSVQALIAVLNRQVRAAASGDTGPVSVLAARAARIAEQMTDRRRQLDCEWHGTTEVIVAGDSTLIWQCPQCGMHNES